MEKEKDFKIIEKISNTKINGLSDNFQLIELFFKICYVYVTETQLAELKFDNSFDGVFEFSNWVHNQLYKMNDPLSVLNQIYLFNNLDNDFTKLYKTFEGLMNDYNVNKYEIYNILSAEIWYRYKEYLNGNI